MKKIITLFLLASSIFTVSCNNNSSNVKDIDINLSSLFGYYDSYPDVEKNLIVKQGAKVNELPAPTPIFPEVYTFKGYGLDEYKEEVLPNDYVLKENDKLFAKFDKTFKRDSLYFLYEARGQSYGIKENQNIIGMMVYCPLYAYVDESSYFIECSDYNAIESMDFEFSGKSIFEAKIVVKPDYIGNLVFKINGLVDSLALGEVVQGGDRNLVSNHKIFAPGNEYIKAICFSSYFESLAALGVKGSFSFLENLQFIDFDGSKISSIPDFTFHNCNGLRYLPYMSNLKTIGISAFNGCYNLTHFDFPEEIERIDQYAFANCGNLTKIKLPKQTKESGNYLFSNCANLKEVDLSNTSYIGINDFIGCNKIENIIIPNNVSFINFGAFKNCLNLKSITFENGTNPLTLSPEIFSGCPKLKSVKLPRQTNKLYDNILLGSSINELDLSNIEDFLIYINLGMDSPIMNKKGKIIVNNSLLSKYINDPYWKTIKDVFVGV